MYTLNMAIIAVLIAFTANIILCPFFIPLLKRIKFGQNVRTDGPTSHLKKSGTPTMGGIVILISFLIASLFFLRGNTEAKLVVFVTLGFGMIGFIDDYIKVVKKRSLGLRAYQKFAMQLIIGAVFIYFIMQDGNDYGKLFIPFTDKVLDVNWIFAPLMMFIILGTVNGVNLTDGLDGLASGVTALVAMFFIFISWTMGSGVLPVSGAAVGSLLGFLLFNAYPAKVFMGDTGSLALGGFVVAVAILLKMPLFLPIVGLVYVIEVLSVIIQVGYFKISKGKRFFLMAPIHHHFELKGIEETKVVTIFYVITAILCLAGFLGTSQIFS